MVNIVVTGIGLVTPLGLGREKSFNELMLSRSAVTPDIAGSRYLSARVRGLYIPPETRLLSLGFLASAEALADSGLNQVSVDYARFASTLSVSKPDLYNSGGLKINFSELFLQSNLGMQVSRILKLGGRVINVSAACATGAVAIIEAARLIEEGACDAAIAGAVESPFHPLYTAGFSQMGVLAKNIACPFDSKREGFALGEGAGVLVLERKDQAMLRGARVYGELAGWGMSCDTSNPVSFGPSGNSIALAVKNALKMAGTGAVDYINAHGTGTKLNDVIESRAYESVFGAGARKIAVSSTKAATGHLLGASGAVEAAFCLLALRDGAVPPTLNLTHPDKECALNYTPHKAAYRNIETALSVSYGFGGQIAALIFKKQ